MSQNMESSAQVVKGAGVRKKRPQPAKTSFNNPFNIEWKHVDGESMAFILEKLKLAFQQTGLCKVEPTLRPRKPRPCKGKKDQEKKMEGDIKEDQQQAEKLQEVTDDHMNRIQEFKQGWTNVELRKQLAIGINEVTRALEKHTLCLVLVCKSVKPSLMTQHLIQLSESREIPACRVPRLSETVAPVLGLKSILALGFKKNSEVFMETVNAITPQIPPLNVPRMQQSKVIKNPEGLESKEQDSISEMPKLELANAGFPPSQKRKFDEVASSDLSIELDDGAKCKKIGVTLLPLKIKKVIPNPNKIRKPKKNKKINKKMNAGNPKKKPKLN